MALPTKNERRIMGLILLATVWFVLFVIVWEILDMQEYGGSGDPAEPGAVPVALAIVSYIVAAALLWRRGDQRL